MQLSLRIIGALWRAWLGEHPATYSSELPLTEKAAQFGAEADLVRVSVGLEDAADLTARFQRALDAISP